jgi:hypothetical protein
LGIDLVRVNTSRSQGGMTGRFNAPYYYARRVIEGVAGKIGPSAGGIRARLPFRWSEREIGKTALFPVPPSPIDARSIRSDNAASRISILQTDQRTPRIAAILATPRAASYTIA